MRCSAVREQEQGQGLDWEQEDAKAEGTDSLRSRGRRSVCVESCRRPVADTCVGGMRARLWSVLCRVVCVLRSGASISWAKVVATGGMKDADDAQTVSRGLAAEAVRDCGQGKVRTQVCRYEYAPGGITRFSRVAVHRG